MSLSFDNEKEFEFNATKKLKFRRLMKVLRRDNS